MVEWLPIPGYEGLYEVSRTGQVRNVKRGRVLAQQTGKGGHRRAILSKNGTQRWFSIHVLVLTAFVGPRPPGLIGCHNNGIPDDNRVENLRWDTYRSNALDKGLHGTNYNLNKSECLNGHEFNEENTYRNPRTGGRYCRKCARDRDRRRRNLTGIRGFRKD